MYAITGITGQVGSAAAKALLANQKQVRAVVRDVDKGKPWHERGCDVVVADVVSGVGLVEAFEAVDGVFILIPPLFDPSPGFPEATAIIEVFHDACYDRGRRKSFVFPQPVRKPRNSISSIN